MCNIVITKASTKVSFLNAAEYTIVGTQRKLRMSVASNSAINYCEKLFLGWADKLSDSQHVRGVDRALLMRGVAKTFPEVRFCKGCVLPVVDQVTTDFLQSYSSATRSEIRSALRCEGFQTLAQYYDETEDMSGYCGSPWMREKQSTSKSGDRQHAGANPDFSVRYEGATTLRVVGEVKYQPKRFTSEAAVEQTKRELQYYLAIKSSSQRDWEHDFGVGVVYCGAGDGCRKGELVLDYWLSDRVAIAYFHA